MVSAERKQQFREILDAVVEENLDTWSDLKDLYQRTGDSFGDVIENDPGF